MNIFGTSQRLCKFPKKRFLKLNISERPSLRKRKKKILRENCLILFVKLVGFKVDITHISIVHNML